MDHLASTRHVHGFCIGGPFNLDLLRRAPNRSVVPYCAAERSSSEMRDLFYDTTCRAGTDLVKRRPRSRWRWSTGSDRMVPRQPDFVFTVTRDSFAPAHADTRPARRYPGASVRVAMEAAMPRRMRR